MPNAKTPKPSFAAAMRFFFGFKPGQGLADFGKEMKELSNEDRQYFSIELTKAGIEHEPPVGVAAAA